MADASAPTFVPSERFDRALARASEYHRRQPRKGSGTPYVGHLLTVAGYVLEDGGSEDEAIAALLHDALEDQYRDDLPAELRDEFGAQVLAIVEGCSQEKPRDERLSWRQRKQRYIDHLDGAEDEIVRVSLADKLANVRSILRDHRAAGEHLWERFNAPSSEDVLWYYERLAERYTALRPGPMAEEFAHEVGRLRWIVRDSAPRRGGESTP
jgi:(p)ppGpp synthase/HD superfamily hydrolase